MKFFPQYVKCTAIELCKNEFVGKIKHTSLNIQGCKYAISDISENTVKLTPKPTGSIYHNSFLPDITMEMQGESSPQKLTLTFELTKDVKWIIGIFQCICLIFQIGLLIGFIMEDWGIYSLFPVCLPILLALFLYLLSHLGLKYSSNRFLKDFPIPIR